MPLLQRSGFRVGVLNHYAAVSSPFVLGALKQNPWNYYRLPREFSARVVHYHHSHWAHLIGFALGPRDEGARYIATLHGSTIEHQLTAPLIGRLTRWALRRFDVIVAVNPTIRRAVERNIDNITLETIPAFIPAQIDERFEYPHEIQTFLESGRTIVVPAYGIMFLRDGRELYGLDVIVAAFTELAVEQSDLRLALFVAKRPEDGEGRRHLATLEGALQEAGIRERTLVVYGLPFTPALRHAEVVVRPSRTDGDALSIREALHAGVPVVASDAVARPEGVLTFPSEDIHALRATLTDALDRPTGSAGKIASAHDPQQPSDDFAVRLISIYRDQLDRTA
jgi:glycosyltransferase involved in cell wall biosynthesis